MADLLLLHLRNSRNEDPKYTLRGAAGNHSVCTDVPRKKFWEHPCSQRTRIPCPSRRFTVLKMCRFFSGFGCRTRPKSKGALLRSRQILHFNSPISITHTEAKRLPDARRLPSGWVCGEPWRGRCGRPLATPARSRRAGRRRDPGPRALPPPRCPPAPGTATAKASSGAGDASPARNAARQRAAG